MDVDIHITLLCSRLLSTGIGWLAVFTVAARIHEPLLYPKQSIQVVQIKGSEEQRQR